MESSSDQEQDDDNFFNDPELHAQLDQVENQFIINSQIKNQTQTEKQTTTEKQQQQKQKQPPTKKIKLNHQSNSKNQQNFNLEEKNQINQESVENLKLHIEQIKQALNQSNSEKNRLKGEVSIIRSKLDSQQNQANKQIKELKQTEIQLRLKAQKAEKELIKLQNQKELQDTFNNLEESSKKSIIIIPSSSNPIQNQNLSRNYLNPTQPASPSPKLQRQQNLLFNQKSKNQQSKLLEINKSKNSHLNFEFNHSTSSPNEFHQFTHQGYQHQPLKHPIPEKSPSFLQPPDPPYSSSPLHSSLYNNTLHHLNELNSQIEDLQIHPPSPNESFTQQSKLINTIVVQLFQCFVVNTHPEQGRKINLTSILQPILNASQQQSTTSSISKRIEKLLLDLFICLSRAFDTDEEKENYFNYKNKRHKKKLNHTFHGSQNHRRYQASQEILDQDENINQLDPDELSILSFVAELGSIFVQITNLLSQTNLLEAQTNSIQILNILAQSSPLFTSYFLNHPDFSTFQNVNQVDSYSTLFSQNFESNRSILVVLIDYFNQIISFFDQDFQAKKDSNQEEENSIPSHSISKEDLKKEEYKLDGMFSIHLGCLNLLESLFWDPPEVCYPTLANFLKSDQVLRFLLMKNQPEINLIKCLNILLSLASRMEFSKIILTSQIPVSVKRNQSPSNTVNNNHLQKQKNKVSNSNTATERSKAQVENQTEGEQAPCNEVEQVSVVEKLIRILILTLDHQINTYQYSSQSSSRYQNSTESSYNDYHEIKTKILSLLNILGKKNSVIHLSSSLSDQIVLNGFQFMSQSCKFLFSILIKLIYVDSYLLWNFDGSLFHKIQVPKYIERIELELDIFTNLVFNNNTDAGSSGDQEKSTSVNLMNRLKQEANEMSTTFNSSRASSSIMMSPNINMLYHEFVLGLSKLCFADHIPCPATITTDTTPTQEINSRSNHDLLGVLSRDQAIKLEHLGDLVHDLLTSFACEDELNDWRLNNLDDEYDEEKYDNNHNHRHHNHDDDEVQEVELDNSQF